jgi:hypothetical protein
MTNVARKGMKFEKTVSWNLNNYFANNLLENVAHANGGAGKGSDVLITGPDGEPLHSYEVKTSNGARTDFGQFRISHDTVKGWQQATGLNNETQGQVFSHIKEELDRQVVGVVPPGPTLSTSDVHAFWNSSAVQRGTRSICTDVIKVNIPKQFIEKYYRDKGDSFIVLGESVYSLTGNTIQPLSEALEECYALFRIKYHKKGSYSYTVTLRGKFFKNSKPNFDEALNKIYS